MTLQPGQTIGRYQIIEPLGVGGMATVYKAFQPSLEREVALKVLRPGFSEDPEFFQRFQREARSIARLRHPNIVQVFDFEPLEGRYILAMEFLEGGTLKERVTQLAAKSQRIPHPEVARIVGEVASALSYGHELGIIHRDVKPSNVMLAARDRAVVTDFGIAKIMGGEGQTQTGVGIGTPEYMAPEQGTGTNVDHRADIYSLGVMAYEMLTGQVPFAADTPIAIVLAHMRDPLPLPSTIDPTVPAATEHVLMKALAKDPGDRYASATDFADALRISLVPAPPTAATVYPIPPLPAAATAATAGAAATGVASATTRGGIPRVALIGAAALALLLLAGAAFALTRGGSSPTASGSAVLFELDPARGQQQLFARGPAVARPVPNAIEIALGPAQYVSFDLIPAVYASDFDATMRVRLVSGTGRVGLFFHSAGDGDLQLALNPSGALQMVRTDPKVPQPSPIASFPTGASLGKDVEMRLVVVGTAITVYADGKEVGRATSPGQRTGAIGILVGSFDSAVTAQVSSLRILGTAVAAPVGAAPGGVQGCAQPPCPPAQGGGQPPAQGGGGPPPAQGGGPPPAQGGGAGSPAVVRKGAQLYLWQTGDPLTSLTIEKTGAGRAETVGNDGLRVIVGGTADDAVKILLPPSTARDSYVVEYELLPAANYSIGIEFVLRGSPERTFKLVVDSALLARVYDDPGQKVVAGPVGINTLTGGNQRFLLTISVAENSKATVYINNLPLFPAAVDISGSNNRQPLGVRIQGGGAGGALSIASIRAWAAPPP